eukprot:5173793-Alexandrium_andersonii.AAC.1
MCIRDRLCTQHGALRGTGHSEPGTNRPLCPGRGRHRCTAWHRGPSHAYRQARAVCRHGMSSVQ